MRRFLKAALLSVVALLAVSVLPLWIFIDRAASAPDLKPRIEKATADFLGRPVAIGALEWRRWPNVMLVAKDFRVYDDPNQARLLVEAPVVEAHVALLSLFKLAAGVTELRFVSPRVALRRGKDGVWNVERLVEEIAARPDEPRRRWGTLAFNWFEVAGGTVTVEDASGALSALAPLAVSGRGKLRFGRKHAHFPFDLAVRPEGSPASLALSGSIGGHWSLRADFAQGDPALAGLVWPPAARWKGRWDASLEHDERKGAAWSLHARAESVFVSTAAPKLDSIEFDGEYAPAALSTFVGVARSSTTEIAAKGSLREGTLDLDVRSPQADVKILTAFAGALAGTGPSRKTEPSRFAACLRATISADDLRYGAAEFHGLHAVVTRSTGAYELERSSVATLGGSVAATGSYLPTGGDQALHLAWTATGVDVQKLFQTAGSSRAVAGVADVEGSLVTGLGARFLPAMNGTVKVDVKNGWTGTPGMLKILTRLNISTLFSEAAGRHQQRVPFDEARGAVTITNGKVSADKPIVLENKTLQMAFMGTYDLPSQTVDGKVVVNFLTVTDEIIRLIPGVGYILLGKEKGLIPVWLSIKGKADDPDVDVLPVKTITAPFWNATRRVLHLPKTLWEKLGL